MKLKRLLIFFILVSFSYTLCKTNNNGERKDISLNGKWDISESFSGNKLPINFSHNIIVPGLVDMASPKFDSVGVKCTKRNYFWYRRFFKISDSIPPVVLLKINKANHGTTVYVNGKKVGFNFFCFTPTLLNIKDYLKPAGEPNELVIRVGAYYDNVPDSIPVGIDIEKIKYIPGIYDDVKIILSNYPFIENVQIAPDINKKLIKIRAEIKSDKDIGQFTVNYSVDEYKSRKEIISGRTNQSSLSSKNKNIVEFIIPIKNCHLWSPDNPFLYNLKLSTGKDTKTVRFGMRSFTFDEVNDRAMLNGKPYSMLGTNICIFRFFEDSSRGDLPWNGKWAQKLFQKFKDMHWNCARFCIGFPPEKWYQIADETGFLVQDEYPLWEGPSSWKTPKIKANVLIDEYTRWMRERWNHPCVIIWDAQNESDTRESGKALSAVRYLDMSNRPWDNGWGTPQSKGDCIEEHPYLFNQYLKPNVYPSKEGYLKDLFGVKREPNFFNDANQYFPLDSGTYKNAQDIDEYDWIWLNRDGSITESADSVYIKLFGNNLTTEQRRLIHAENLAIVTEYWRCHRASAALMYFCGLGYSRPYGPNGYTSDDWIDVKNLIFEPIFEKYIKREFLPVCIMIDNWDKEYPAGHEIKVPVYAINDLLQGWQGTLKLTLLNGENKIIKILKKNISVLSFGRNIIDFDLKIPNSKGSYKLVAETLYKKDSVKSIREFSLN